MFTDANGDSRFDTCAIPWNSTIMLRRPNPLPILAAKAEAAAQYVFFQLPAKWYGEPHPTPIECLVVCLSGSFKFIGSAGDELIMKPGDRVLDLNTTGKGHVSETVSDGLA
jgi:hypothetical protein